MRSPIRSSGSPRRAEVEASAHSLEGSGASQATVDRVLQQRFGWVRVGESESEIVPLSSTQLSVTLAQPAVYYTARDRANPHCEPPRSAAHVYRQLDCYPKSTPPVGAVVAGASKVETLWFGDKSDG
jgi:hypothetical protein